MSESVTNLEIEDVLTSIRRLVMDKGVAVKDAPENGSDKFVLTPALRIIDTVESEPSAEAAEITSQPINETEETAEEAAKLDASHSDPFETSVKLGVADAAIESPIFRRPERPDVSPDSHVVELEAAILAHPDDWEPDGSEPDAGKMPATHIFETTRRMREVANEKPAPLVLEPKLAVVDENTIHHDFTQGNSTEEAVIDVTTDPVQELIPEVSEQEAPIAMPDQEALRLMIAEMVREELEGVMGERITQNVRRMVRREVQRAISLRDFD